MKLLFATKNPAKIKFYAKELEKEGYEIVTIKDLEREVEIIENGINAIENAKIKAEAYFKVTGITTIGIDDNLFIEGLPDEVQPKTHVRRVNGQELTDDEMLEHYMKIVRDLGGEARVYWLHGIALCIDGKTKTFERRTNLIFKDKKSNKVSKGYPLDSITWMPEYNKFLSELNEEENNMRKSNVSGKQKAITKFILENI